MPSQVEQYLQHKCFPIETESVLMLSPREVQNCRRCVLSARGFAVERRDVDSNHRGLGIQG